MKKLLLGLLLTMLLVPTFNVYATTQIGQWIIEDLTDSVADDVVCARYQISPTSSAWSGGSIIAGTYGIGTSPTPGTFQVQIPTGKLYGVIINFYPLDGHNDPAHYVEFADGVTDNFPLPFPGAGNGGWGLGRNYGGGIETNFIKFHTILHEPSGKYNMRVYSVTLTVCDKVPPDGCNNIFYWDYIGWTGGVTFPIGASDQLSYGNDHATPGTVRLNFQQEVTFQHVEVAWAQNDDGTSNTTFTTEDQTKTIAVHDVPYNYNGEFGVRARWTDDFEFDAPTTTEWLDISAPAGANKDRRIIWVKIDTCLEDVDQLQRPFTEADEFAPGVWDGFPPDDYPIASYCSWLLLIGFSSCNIITEIESVSIYRMMDDSPQPLKWAISKQPLAPVYNIVEGTVILKEKILLEDCLYYAAGDIYANQTNGCIFEIPPYANDDGVTVERSRFKRIDPAYNDNLWRVYVLTDDEKLITYILTDPSVEVGDRIKINCIIGRSIPVGEPTWTQQQLADFVGGLEQHFSLLISIANFVLGGGADVLSFGGVVMIGYEDYEPESYINETVPGTKEHNLDQVYLVKYPDPDLACNIDPEYSDCLTINPRFANDGEFWTSLNPARPAIWLNPGVILEPGGGIQLAALPLDTGDEYGASFTAWTETGDSELQVNIGQESFEFDIYPGTDRGYTIEPQEMSPTVGTLYDIVLLNTGANDITISFFCLVEGTPNLYPSECYFKNNGFDVGLLFWQTTGDVKHIYTLPEGLPPWDLGKARLQMAPSFAYAALKQNIHLLPGDDGPHTYEWFIQYEIPPGSGDWTFIAFLEVDEDPVYTEVTLNPAATVFEGDFEVTTELNGSMVFSFSNYDEEYIDITKICIRGPFPGQGGGGEETDPGTCDVPPTFPSGGDVQTVLSWHWNSFNRFHQCQLMPMLFDIFKQITKAYNFATNQGQFWMYTAYKGITWSGTHLFPWLAGYLSNISPGTITVNNQQCSGFDLICIISQLIEFYTVIFEGILNTLPDLINNVIRPIVDFILWVLGSAVNLFFAVLTALIVLVLGLFAEVIRVLSIGVNVLIELVNVWNTAPALPISGLPSCAGTDSEGVCLVWWVMENTIFAGPGAIIIPLIASFGWIMLGLWIVKQTKELTRDVGAAS